MKKFIMAVVMMLIASTAAWKPASHSEFKPAKLLAKWDERQFALGNGHLISLADGDDDDDSKGDGGKAPNCEGKDAKMSECQMGLYIFLWVCCTPIALICCCCAGCDHFEGGVKEEDEKEVLTGQVEMI